MNTTPVTASSTTVEAPPRKRPRGGDRRQALLETTLRVIGEEGIDAVSHRRVAELAEVPLGSTTYWFSSRHEMLTEALEQFAREEIENLRGVLAGVLDRRLSRARLVDEFTDFLLHQLGEASWRTRAQYSLLQEAGRLPELEPVCREWTRAWHEALSEVFASLGAKSPELEARMFLAMLDGLLLGQLAVPEEDAENTVIRPSLRAWFSRIPSERA